MQYDGIRKWFILASLSVVFFVVTAGSFSSLGVVLPKMVKELNWNWAEAGLGYTLLGISCGIASVFPSLTIRKLGVRGTIFLGGILLIAGFLSIGLAVDVWPYLIGEVLVGLAFALLSVIIGTYVLTNIFHKPSIVLGAYFTIGAMGGVAGPQIYRITNYISGDWRIYWFVFAIASLISCIFAFLSLPKYGVKETDKSNESKIADGSNSIPNIWTLGLALKTPQFYIIVAGYSTYLLANMTTHGFAVQHLLERGINETDAGIMLSMEAFVAAIASIVGGILGKKLSPKFLMLLSLAAATIGTYSLAIATSWTLMWVYILGLGTGYGLSLLSATMLLLEYYGKKSNLELFSAMCLLSTLAALGSVIGGWLHDITGSFYLIMILQSLFSLGILALTIFLKQPKLPEQEILKTISSKA